MGKQSVTIVPYQIRVKKRKKDEYCLLDNINGQQLFKMVSDLLGRFGNVKEDDATNPAPPLTQADIDEDSMVAFRVTSVAITGSLTTTHTQTIEAVFELGEYGAAGKLFHTQTMQETHKDKEVADLCPFYVRFDFHNGQDTGLMLIQQYGKRQARGTFCDKIRSYFRENEHNSGFMLKCNSFVTDDYIRSIGSIGVIKKIRLIRKAMPSELSERLNGQFDEQNLNLETVFSAQPKQWIARKIGDIVNAWRGRIKAGNAVGIEEEDDGERLKIEIDLGRGKRTLNFGGKENQLPFMAIDITESVVLNDSTNHPEFQSVSKAAFEIVSELCPQLGWPNVPSA